jgi:thiol-disulfide isomerase/thioredoxin
MRFAISALALLLMMTVPAAAGTDPATPIIQRFQGKEIPPLAAADRAGNPVRLADFRGRIVIVNLWASWCAPCRTEMPSLERLADLYPDDLIVVAISNDAKGWPAIDQFLGQSYPRLHVELATEPGRLDAFGALGLPYSLIVDRDGREIARVLRGIEWDKGSALTLVSQSIASGKK